MYSGVVVLLVALAVSSEARYWKEEEFGYGLDRPITRIDESDINVMRSGRYPVENVDLDLEWQSALMEFTQFVGKCEIAKTFLDMVTLQMPINGVIARACPLVSEVADRIMMATPEQVVKAEKLFKGILHVGQCVNLRGELELLYLFSNFTTNMGLTTNCEIEINVFTHEVEPMFRWCEMMFNNVEEEILTFKTGLNQIKEIVDEPVVIDWPRRHSEQEHTVTDTIVKLRKLLQQSRGFQPTEHEQQY